MSEDTEINMEDDMMKEIEQVRKSLKLTKKDIKDLVNMLQESRDTLEHCGYLNPSEALVGLLAFAMELNKIGLRPKPDVKPIGGTAKGVFWPDGLDT